ncbi:SURF1 family cytochrome oxidase biogenesis protein [Agrobacterium vitis]|uniref:SURF1 family cytochrome oxidase biogenesis protein n=1 Tax=Agrobacterium vitis TaxID=373 RepID=UPI003D7F1B13
MSDQQAIRRISIKKVALSSFLLLATALFIALGIWQIERLGWKQALIARVDARVHAETGGCAIPSAMAVRQSRRR